MAQSLHGNLNNESLNGRRFAGVSIDSRSLTSEQLFVAIVGENNNGHNFVGQALENGAAGLLLSRHECDVSRVPQEVPVVTVDDTHNALIQLAVDYLDAVAPKRVGITGSNGKTTTKELTYQLIHAVEKSVYRTPGNLNNLYGIPLSILSMPSDVKIAVMEMGISTPGEMARLAKITRPDVAVVTNVSETHLEFLETVENVAREKLDIVSASDNATLVVNCDDSVLMNAVDKRPNRKITFGLSKSCDIHPDDILTQRGGTTVTIEGNTFVLPLFGEYQVYNLLAAYAVAREIGCDFSLIDTSAIKLSTAPLRGERLSLGGAIFVNDSYNANPVSMRLGLETFAREAVNGRRIIVIGDMLELGAGAEEHHRAIGRLAGKLAFDLVVGVGPLCEVLIEEAQKVLGKEKATLCADVDSAARYLKRTIVPGDVVLLKGSRGIGLDRIPSQMQKQEGSN